MSVVVVGLNERDASLDLLEGCAVNERDLPKVLQGLCDSPHLSETVVLSTCMRTEVYAVLERFHDGLSDIQSFFLSRLGNSAMSAKSLEEQLMVSYDDAAARHLFQVAAGIDCAVLGEGEILRQVRHAGERARTERAAGPVLGGLFRHAIQVGKRARSETAIARGMTSFAHVAVGLAQDRCGGSLEGRKVLVIGAGEMGEGILDALEKATGSPEIIVTNRNAARARTLAAPYGATVIDLGAMKTSLADFDVILTATAAEEVLFEPDDVRANRPKGTGADLVIVDVAMPRDVDPAVGEIDGVTLFDVDDLRTYAEAQMVACRSEVPKVEAIIDEELDRYREDASARSMGPLISTLRNRGEEIRKFELDRVRSRLEGLSVDDQETVDAVTKRIVAKLLHEPTIQVKQAAGSARGERLSEALRSLFDL